MDQNLSSVLCHFWTKDHQVKFVWTGEIGVCTAIFTLTTFCCSLEIFATKEERLDGLIDVTQQRVETKLDSIVMTLNKNANTVQECMEGALKMQLLEQKAEEAEKNRWKTSVIVHGIPDQKQWIQKKE